MKRANTLLLHPMGGALLCMLLLLGGVSGCTSFLSASGPSKTEVARKQAVRDAGIQVLTVDASIAELAKQREKVASLSSLEAGCRSGDQRVGPGDILSIAIWESPPAALFGANSNMATGSIQTTSGPVTLPPQQVTRPGTISVPFAGSIQVKGLTTSQIGKKIYDRLKGKANEPQIIVTIVKNVSSSVTVVGEVNKDAVMSLTPKCERLLDVLATAGLKAQTSFLTVQLTREGTVHSVPLDNLIRDKRENIHLEPGDVVAVLSQPLSFTALGATGKNKEIHFEAKGITLAQALARAGGLLDQRADAQGVFIFRYEPQSAMPWHQPVAVTSEGQVPVIYTVDLHDAKTFFAAKSFPIKDKDLLYVSNAPAAQLQKFMTLVGSLVNPMLTSTARVHTISNY